MAVIIEANYSKKVGLPNFSSHQYSVTLRTEISDLSQLEKANAELYAKLQGSVDTQILNVGVMPSDASTHHQDSPNRPLPQRRQIPLAPEWRCSDKQRDLILKIIGDHHLETASIDSLAVERFGVGLRQLNKVQASGLIEELIETYGKSQSSGRNGRQQSNAFQGRGGR